MAVADWLAPTVLSSIIAGAVGLATHFSAQRARRAESSEDIRTEAFNQAKGFYQDIISRQDADMARQDVEMERQSDEITKLRTDVTEALRRATAAEESADIARAAIRALNSKLSEKDRKIEEQDRELSALRDRLNKYEREHP